MRQKPVKSGGLSDNCSNFALIIRHIPRDKPNIKALNTQR